MFNLRFNPQNLVPTVIDNSEQWGGHAYDIYSMLLKNRIVFLGTSVRQEVANVVVAQLLYLNSQSSTQPIHFYINSPGGEVYAGFAMYDAMQMIEAPVYTYAVGMTASMGTGLLAAGAAGHRYALPHATIHLHPTSSGMQGYTQDVRISLREQERIQTQLFHLIAKHSHRTWQELERDFTRDRFMQAIEAKEYGLIDHVLGDSSSVLLRLEDDSFGLAQVAVIQQLADKADKSSVKSNREKSNGDQKEG